MTDTKQDRLFLTVSVDTEEDNWVPATEGVTARNILALPRLVELFAELGVRPTYFTTYRVAEDEEAAVVMRGIRAREDSEIGAHLHPWNTPPVTDRDTSVSMLRSYPVGAQRAKLGVLLQTLREQIGVEARSFRAGRFGVGPETIGLLLDVDVRVDSSVTPLVSWAVFDGPSFLDAPVQPYPLDGTGTTVSRPAPRGPLIEMPVTVGYTRLPVAAWSTLARIQQSPILSRLRLPGLAARFAGVSKVILTPETQTADEMLELSRNFRVQKMQFLHMYFHSNSLTPGLTPFARTRSDVERIYTTIGRYVEELSRVAEVKFLTVSEAAGRYDVSRSGRRLRDTDCPELGKAV